MGLGLFNSFCSCGTSPSSDVKLEDFKKVVQEVSKTKDLFGNPNPKNFTILRYFEYPHPRGSRTVVEVQYPDAKNFEGRKIMLYLCDFATIAKQKTLDPHFCDNATAKAHESDYVSPFARFEPTIDGWRAAAYMAVCLP